MRAVSVLVSVLVPLFAACSGDHQGDGGTSAGAGAAGGEDVIFGADSSAGSSGGGLDSGPSQDAAAVADSGSDASGPEDAGAPADTAAGNCPGGSGCPCETNDDCDTAICLQYAADKRCATKCTDSCPAGEKCVSYAIGGGDSTNVCAPVKEWLCNPCTSSQECRHVGLGEAVCVDYGLENGSFCGIPCSGKDACPVGYTCRAVTSIEGGAAKQCVHLGAGDAFGTCECNDTARTKKLTTSCAVVAKDAGGAIVSKCPGKRRCGQEGLSKCIGPAPGAEVCDGADNDCDGKTDEDGCDDGNPCTADACKAAAKQCVHVQHDGPCDADGNACTQSDACTDGVCLPGKVKVCDDGNPCTLDVCEQSNGKCTVSQDDGQACDADGNICTQGDHCEKGTCLAGKLKNCDPGKACVAASCDPVKGACIFTNQTQGQACDDGHPCTEADACDASATCAGKPKGCDDGNLCTLDRCDPATGCVSKVESGKAVECFDGPPAKQGVGACRAGKRVCRADGSLGACEGEVLPAQGDPCNGLDDDCDGVTDKGCGAAGILVRVSGGGLDASAGKYRLRAIVGGTAAGRRAGATGAKHGVDWGLYALLGRALGK